MAQYCNQLAGIILLQVPFLWIHSSWITVSLICKYSEKLVMGEGHSASTSYSVKLCVMINFSLCHNVLCFSFVVVLHSMCSL